MAVSLPPSRRRPRGCVRTQQGPKLRLVGSVEVVEGRRATPCRSRARSRPMRRNALRSRNGTPRRNAACTVGFARSRVSSSTKARGRVPPSLTWAPEAFTPIARRRARGSGSMSAARDRASSRTPRGRPRARVRVRTSRRKGSIARRTGPCVGSAIDDGSSPRFVHPRAPTRARRSPVPLRGLQILIGRKCTLCRFPQYCDHPGVGTVLLNRRNRSSIVVEGRHRTVAPTDVRRTRYEERPPLTLVGDDDSVDRLSIARSREVDRHAVKSQELRLLRIAEADRPVPAQLPCQRRRSSACSSNQQEVRSRTRVIRELMLDRPLRHLLLASTSRPFPSSKP